MLIFHEGLPGSGKSFAAFVDHIIPALKKGRSVYAYVEGLDHEKIAAAADMPLEHVRVLLRQITREQVPNIHAHVKNDSLVVIDELQNFWPSGRQKLSPDITQFVTEHRHRGLDVLCMGQVLNDCHALWKGRIDTKISFMKRDGVGKADEYKWTVFKNVSGKFRETTSGTKKYDPKYFGCYKSHTDDTSNTDSYADSRANIRNGKVFKFIKFYVAAAALGVGFIVWWFASGGGGMGKKPEAAKPPVVAVDPNAVAAAENSKVVQAVAKELPKNAVEVMKQVQEQAVEYIDQLSEKGRIRLGGTVKTQKRMTGHIEWRDPSNRLLERLSPEQLQALGWYVMLSPDGSMATISKPGKTYVATQWPLLDDRAAFPERVPDVMQRRITVDTPAKIAQLN